MTENRNIHKLLHRNKVCIVAKQTYQWPHAKAKLYNINKDALPSGGTMLTNNDCNLVSTPATDISVTSLTNEAPS